MGYANYFSTPIKDNGIIRNIERQISSNFACFAWAELRKIWLGSHGAAYVSVGLPNGNAVCMWTCRFLRSIFVHTCKRFFTCRKILLHWGLRLYFPSEGRRAALFYTSASAGKDNMSYNYMFISSLPSN
jgi:hypothetical protein